MPTSAKLFLGVSLAILAVLDLVMVISLLRPGDERSQVVVWKASVLTLFGTVGANILTVIHRFASAQPMTVNPLVCLEVTAVIYFFSLTYYRRKHSG